jgi:hypothetical protein
MNVKMFIVTVALFYLLTPGLFLSIPEGGNLETMAVVHGIVFAILYIVVIKHILAPYLA